MQLRPTLTSYSMPSVVLPTASKIWRAARLMTPSFSPSPDPPSMAPAMVYVLPLPDWPYAKNVPWKPARTFCTSSRAAASYTSACDAAGPNTPSNVKH